MTRKSKQRGGHNPLTYDERKKYGKGEYGTQTMRLGAESQMRFGDCCLSLHSAVECPVATPQGYIYEKSALLEYMLNKTKEIQKEQAEYDLYIHKLSNQSKQQDEENRKKKIREFEETQKGVALFSSSKASKKLKASSSGSSSSSVVEENPLSTTSYWLADSMDVSGGGDDDDPIKRKPPPKRPASPNSQRPLRRKDLVELAICRPDNGGNSKTKDSEKVLCAISEKPISTQQAVAIITKTKAKAENKAHVVLETVLESLGGDAKKICPITGRKIKQILKLQKGGSSFASLSASSSDKFNSDSSDAIVSNSTQQSIVAKRYRPTMT